MSLLFLCMVCFTACGSEDTEETMIPPVEKHRLSGEGESVLVSLDNSNWQIVGVTTIDKSFAIFGEIYGPDGKLICSNTQLTLKGLGRIESVWTDQGFVITRDNFHTLKVEALENSTDKDFGFTILLKSDTETKEIIINQGQSEGYSFEKIEYTLIPGSYTKVWYKNGFFNLSNHTNQEFEMLKYNPFQNQSDNFTFDSDDSRAFACVKDEALSVEVPGGVLHGELFYNHEEVPYKHQTVKQPLKFSVSEVPIKTPMGDSQCHFELEYEEYKAVYHLFVKSRKTGVEKKFEGTFTSSTLNGSYKLVWDSENKPTSSLDES